MKWGKKKTHSYAASSCSSSPSLPRCSQPSSLISHVFPVSWLSKFKHKNTSKPEPKPRKLTEKCPSNNGSGKLYYAFDDDDNDDAFSRLSFGPDNAGEKKSKRVVGLKPSVWFEEPFSSCPNCSVMPKCKRETDTVLGSKSAQELKRSMKNPGGLGKVEEDDFCGDKMSFDLQSPREMNAKSDEQRKSFYVSMEKQKKRNGNNNKRVKVYSPRTALRAETCKVKALEDMKKSKLKKRKKRKKKKTVESSAGLGGFAVVKSSYDPENDFKDSMVEMILEKNMRHPDELEELLACYLTLNSDEFHGLIIKVFREVWLELGELRE